MKFNIGDKVTNRKRALRLAVDGGYKNIALLARWKVIYCLDPDFWKAIAHAKKWDKPIWKCKNKDGKINKRCDSLFCKYAGYQDVEEMSERWFFIHVWGVNKRKLEDQFWTELIEELPK